MTENINNPANDPKNQNRTERQDDELDIGNDMSIGNDTGTNVSDFDPENDSPETEEKEYQEAAGTGDDQRSDDNGINPSPGEVNTQYIASNNHPNVENADEDELNPYPDELKPHHDHGKPNSNSTGMISGNEEV